MSYTPRIQFVGNSSRRVDTFSDSDWALLTRMERAPADESGEMKETMVEDTPLLINIKGCGYPPNIICDDYAETYENFSSVSENIEFLVFENPFSGWSYISLLLFPNESLDCALNL